MDLDFGIAALSVQPQPLLILLAALLIDAASGNIAVLRRIMPHPVSMIAAGTAWLESRLNRERRSPYARLVRGMLVVIAVTGIAFTIGWAVAVVGAMVPFGWLLALLVVGALVAQRGPFDEVRTLVRGLKVNDLDAARMAAGAYMGTAAATCDEAALVRGAVGHLAAQFLDGLVAAVFWFVLLGLPGLVAWRAVNVTGRLLESSEPRYVYFGWAPTRFNDALAYLPGLIAGLLIVIAAAFVPAASPGRALRVMLRDGSKHRSLSQGSPIAALAGALGITLTAPRQLLPGVPSRAVAMGTPGAEPWVGGKDGRSTVSRADAVRALYLYAVGCLLVFLGVAILVAIWVAGG